MPTSWGLKASAHYVLRYLASVIVDGIWLVSAMVDGKQQNQKQHSVNVEHWLKSKLA